MHSASPHPSGLFLGAATSALLLIPSIIPEVPPIAQWVCLILSASASVLTIIKNSKK